MQDTTVSRHGNKRMKGRAGLKRSAHPAVAKRAFDQGLSMDETSGRLREWVTNQYATRSQAREMRLYAYRLFIFGQDSVLITVMDLPGDLRGRFEMAMLKKEKAAAQDVEARKTTDDEREETTMGELTIINHEGTLVTDSRDVAEWVEMRHGDLLEKVNGYKEFLLNGKFRSVEFFIESTYQDSTGRTLPCYLITKKG